MTEPWLGHWDGCSIQYSVFCDCGPEPVGLSETPPEPAWMTTLGPDEVED